MGHGQIVPLRSGWASTASPSDFYERDGELAVLQECLASVNRAGRGRVVLVSAEAGGGKTALLRSFCEALTGAVRTLLGTCDPLFTPRPFGPLFVVAEGTSGELKKAVADAATPYDVVLALGQELRRCAPGSARARGPPLGGRGDPRSLHAAGPSGGHRAGAGGGDLPGRLLGTCPPSPARPRGTGYGPRGATPETGPAFARSRLRHGAPHGVEGRELYDKTGGNPFFVVEVLSAGAGEIPATVTEAVLARAGRLSPAAQRLARGGGGGAAAGRALVVGGPGRRGAQALDECVSAGVLVADAGGVTFRHELARLSVEGSLGPGRKNSLHRKALCRAVQFPQQPPPSSPAWPITPKPPVTPRRSYGLPSPRPGGPPRQAPTARPPPSTHGCSGSVTASRWRSGPTCSSSGRTSAT